MAQNLAKSLKPAKDSLSVFDNYAPTLDSFKQACPSASIAQSSTECIQNSDVVITMLPNTDHVESVFQPFLTSSSSSLANKLFIDSSTISPKTTKVLSDQLQQKYPGAILIDAPVSGGVVGATNGTLTFMISLPSSDPAAQQKTAEDAKPTTSADSSAAAATSLETRVKEILSTMGKKIIVCGDYPGAGLSAKLANNYLLALNNIATCEAMLLGQKLGLDPVILGNVLNTSTGRCWPSEANNPVRGVTPNAPVERDYDGGFGVGLMRKDLELALVALQQAGTVTEGMSTGGSDTKGSLSDLSKVALNLYKEVEQTERFSKKDFSVVYQYLKEM